MTPKLEAFAERVAQANDQLMEKHQLVNTLMGIMDKALRQQGLAADAVTIDAVELDKKVVFLLRDQDDSCVEVALGNKAGEIFQTQQFPLSDLKTEIIVQILEDTLLS